MPDTTDLRVVDMGGGRLGVKHADTITTLAAAAPAANTGTGLGYSCNLLRASALQSRGYRYALGRGHMNCFQTHSTLATGTMAMLDLPLALTLYQQMHHDGSSSK